MDKADAVIEKTLKRITPTEKERRDTREAMEAILEATAKAIRPHRLKHTLAGSFLRDTWLTDKKEFDVFILFPPRVARERLEKLGLEIGKKVVKSLGGKHEIAYAEHPYVRAEIGGYAVDFVPCYDIRDPGKIQSAVDRTPHHNRYVLENLNDRMQPQVRLLKQFCKGIGVYGSDLKVEGFSGYLTELLVIQYGTFRSVVREAAGWEAGKVFIDPGKRHEGKKPDTRSMFPGQPMVVIDPVDPKRNVAAAASPASFETFKESCRGFLKSPGESFFRPRKEGLDARSIAREMKKRDTKLLSVSFKRPPVVDDVVYPQLRRSARRISGMLSGEGFGLIWSDVWCDEKDCVVLLELETWSLPATRKVTGPPVFSKQHSDQFVRKYRGRGRIRVEGKNWIAEDRRKFTRASELLRKSLKRSRKKLLEAGIASHVAEGLSRGFVMREDDRIAAMAARNPGFALFLTRYVKGKII